MSNSKLDLTISRVIKAPRPVVWSAWENPDIFIKWWAPAPVITTSNKHDFFTGGGFDTTMQLEDGTVMERGEGCFLEVLAPERIVFTDALRGGWRPNEKAFFSAIITLEDHPGGTLYSATVLHKNADDRQKHEDMGFMDGWGTALDQLANTAEAIL